MSDEPKRAALYCPHCGNTSVQVVVHTQPCVATLYTVPDAEESTHTARYTITRCETCLEILVYYRVDEFVEYSPTADLDLVAWGDLVYPGRSEFPDAVPVPLRELYREALMIKAHSPTSFVILARRLLEEICKDKLGNCSNLAAALKTLAENESLPWTLAKASSLIRLVGNAGAHASEQRINPLLASAVDSFVRAIIEYLYIAPAEVDEFTKRFSHFAK